MARHVLFDVDGVIVHGYHAREDLRRPWDTHIEADLGISKDDFFRHFIAARLIPEVLTGKIGLVKALEETLPELGYTGSPMTIISYWLTRDTQLNYPLIERIKQLRASGDADLFLATNQEDIRAFYLWNTLGLQHIFSDILHAARLGATKPDPAFFERAAALLPPSNEKPLMFDDAPSVVEAAREFGWEAVLYNHLEDFTGHPWIAERIT
ncbi:HAD-IA family hydrolase [Pelagibacterium xiamenense]|uniref:HAD-IA family hydrolase n=1 Tax=Pelagibacterium xiamenense TaxID=2901140 RepID=UPI001E40F2BC|nr:HAD-IA family hydrolase [Pelagibacterium xiamenense]MCD7059967.1 HAD-IA family hydrolase [Pelagibacterium xiamenense]